MTASTYILFSKLLIVVSGLRVFWMGMTKLHTALLYTEENSSSSFSFLHTEIIYLYYQDENRDLHIFRKHSQIYNTEACQKMQWIAAVEHECLLK